MSVDTTDDISKRAYAAGEFDRKLRQREGSTTASANKFAPLCIRFLANEMIALGESFLT